MRLRLLIISLLGFAALNASALECGEGEVKASAVFAYGWVSAMPEVPFIRIVKEMIETGPRTLSINPKTDFRYSEEARGLVESALRESVEKVKRYGMTQHLQSADLLICVKRESADRFYITKAATLSCESRWP